MPLCSRTAHACWCGLSQLWADARGLALGADYFAHANASVTALAMIETAQGLKNVAEIAATPGVDGLYVGPFDLSISLGLTKPTDFTDPVLLAALDVVLDAAGAPTTS